VPILACTGTCRTSTFNLIWDTLGYGHRPFWGLNVGTDQPNLYFIARPLTDPKSPLLDILNLLPKVIDNKTILYDIPKTILYFDSEDMCRTIVRLLRQVLPSHLRECVQAFSSDLEEDIKGAIWDSFQKGQTRILCATDAAGMGCNVPDIKYVVSFGLPQSNQQCWSAMGSCRTRSQDRRRLHTFSPAVGVPPFHFSNPPATAQWKTTQAREEAGYHPACEV